MTYNRNMERRWGKMDIIKSLIDMVTSIVSLTASIITLTIVTRDKKGKK